MQPFIWGQGGEKVTPQMAARQREMASALFGQNQGMADNGWEGLAQVARAFTGTQLNNRADEAERIGREEAAALFGQLDPTSDLSTIMSMAGNEWATDSERAIANLLMQDSMKRSALEEQRAFEQPMRDAQLQQLLLGNETAQVKLDQLRDPPPVVPDPTSGMQNYEYLVGLGVDPVEAQGLAFGSGGTTINNMGNIPAGYTLQYDEAGNPVSMAPIPGSPAALEADAANDKADMRMDQATVVSDTIVNEARKAREAMEGFGSTGVGNWLTGGVGFTPAGQLNQHVSALKSIAAAENINAMRQASPTGGALGNASDADIKLLQDKAGALDPQSPEFASQLDDYERTLLRIVHGPEAGDAIFNQTRDGPREIGTEEEYQALPSGTEFIAPDGSIRVKP